MSEPKMQIKVKSHDYTEFETEVSAEEGKALIDILGKNNNLVISLLANLDISKLDQVDYNELWGIMRDKQRELEKDYAEKCENWTNEDRLRFAGYTDKMIKEMLDEHPDEDPEEVFFDEISYWE